MDLLILINGIDDRSGRDDGKANELVSVTTLR